MVGGRRVPELSMTVPQLRTGRFQSAANWWHCPRMSNAPIATGIFTCFTALYVPQVADPPLMTLVPGRPRFLPQAPGLLTGREKRWAG